MLGINIGDKVRIKDRTGWPSPPGYRFTNAEGTVVKLVEGEETVDDFLDYVHVRLDKFEKDDEDTRIYIGQNLFFRKEDLEKL